jgi:hypothetical protein
MELRVVACASVLVRRISRKNPKVPRLGSSGFFTTEGAEDPRGTAGVLGQDEQDGSGFTELECWNAGSMECRGSNPVNPVNPVCDFGCSSVALCGPLWPSVVHAFDLRLGFRQNDFDDESAEKPNPRCTSHWVGIKRNAPPPYVRSSELPRRGKSFPQRGSSGFSTADGAEGRRWNRPGMELETIGAGWWDWPGRDAAPSAFVEWNRPDGSGVPTLPEQPKGAGTAGDLGASCKTPGGVVAREYARPEGSPHPCASARSPAVRLGVCFPFAPLATLALMDRRILRRLRSPSPPPSPPPPASRLAPLRAIRYRVST